MRKNRTGHAMVFVGGVVIASLLPMGAASAQKASPSSAPAPPTKTDSDGDKLFDDLESELATQPDEAAVSVIVTLREAATEDRVRGLERRLGLLDVGHRFGIVPAFSARMTKGIARALARQPDVDHVEADSPVRTTNDTAQSGFGVTAARAAVPGLDGSGVRVAVIDTGVAVSHGDLAGKVVAFRDYIGGRTTPYDDHGHGTHVAATIAGSGAGNPAHAGAAPAANLIAAKVLDAGGGGSMSNTTAAIDWAVTQGARVINLSLGTTGCADGTDATSRAVDNAAAQGILVAVAAGNAGPGSCTIGSPGAAGGALTVGAMADLAHRGYNLADFSSRGRPGAIGAALKPDVAAPGVGIVSADAFSTSGYRTMSGTSMATPFVAAVGALMLDNGVAAADLKPRIQSTADDWGAGGDDIEFGSGRLDAYKAITGADDPSPRPAHAFRQSSLAGTGSVVDYEISATDTRFPVTAMLVHPGITGAGASTPDFDLYLYSPTGAEVARAETISRQETVAVTPAVAGNYRVRVRSYSGAGSFQLDWSAGSTPSPTESSTTIAPRSLSPAGDPSTLGADDDRFYTLASTTTGTRRTTWVATFANVPADITALTVTYTGKNSAACTQKLSLRKASGIWVQTYSGSLGATEATVTTGPSDAASEYVAGGVLKVRVACATSVNFTTYGELLTLRYDRPGS